MRFRMVKEQSQLIVLLLFVHLDDRRQLVDPHCTPDDKLPRIRNEIVKSIMAYNEICIAT